MGPGSQLTVLGDGIGPAPKRGCDPIRREMIEFKLLGS